MLKRERRLALMPYLWDRISLYGTVVITTRRGRPRFLLKGVVLEDGTWVSDHLWVSREESDIIEPGSKVKVIGKVVKYLPYGEIHESYGIEVEAIEVI